MTDTVFEAWPAAPSLPKLRRRGVGQAVRAAVGIAGLLAAATLVVLALRVLLAASPPRPAAVPAAWRDIIKPVRIYSFEAPEFARAPVAYTARHHAAGGGREDVLALGTLDGDKPAIRLRIFRRAEEAAIETPLFADLAHEAAQAGLAVGRVGLPDLLPTRFGRFDIADVSLAPQNESETICGGFRLLLDKPALAITGLACGPRAAPPLSRADIGCLIERLDAASARDDRELIDFFARSELRRNVACAGMRLGPDGLHAPWLDDPPTTENPDRVVARDDKPATARKRLRHR